MGVADPELEDAQMGSETPTNASFCNASTTLSTAFVKRIPVNMTRKLYTHRKRSEKLRELKAESLDWKDSQQVALWAP